VYVAGFSTSQAAYDAAVTALHASLAQMDSRLEDTRFLMGDRWVGR
jgi:putative glutathione S-transferase